MPGDKPEKKPDQQAAKQESPVDGLVHWWQETTQPKKQPAPANREVSPPGKTAPAAPTDAHNQKIRQDMEKLLKPAVTLNVENKLGQQYTGGIVHHNSEEVRRSIRDNMTPELARELQTGRDLVQQGYKADSPNLSPAEKMAIGNYQIFREQVKEYHGSLIEEDTQFQRKVFDDLRTKSDQAPRTFSYEAGRPQPNEAGPKPNTAVPQRESPLDASKTTKASAGGDNSRDNRTERGPETKDHDSRTAPSAADKAPVEKVGGGYRETFDATKPAGGGAGAPTRLDGDGAAQRQSLAPMPRESGGPTKAGVQPGDIRGDSRGDGRGTSASPLSPRDARPVVPAERGVTDKPAKEVSAGGVRGSSTTPAAAEGSQLRPRTASTPTESPTQKVSARGGEQVPQQQRTEQKAVGTRPTQSDTATPTVRRNEAPSSSKQLDTQTSAKQSQKFDNATTARTSEKSERQLQRSDASLSLTPKQQLQKTEKSDVQSSAASIRLAGTKGDTTKGDTILPQTAKNPRAVVESVRAVLAGSVAQNNANLDRSSTARAIATILRPTLSRVEAATAAASRRETFTPIRPGSSQQHSDVQSGGRTIRVPITDGRIQIPGGPRGAGDVSIRITPGFSPGARGAVDASGRPIAGDAKTFTTAVRIQDKRYILGTEVALAAVITAASIARQRADQQRPDQRVVPRPGEQPRPQPATRIDAQPPLRPVDTRIPVPNRPVDQQVSTRTDRIDPTSKTGITKPGEQQTFTVQGRIDKRYITSVEVALGSVLVASAIARVRGDRTTQVQQPQDKTLRPQDKTRQPQDKNWQPQDKIQQPSRTGERATVRPIRPGELPPDKEAEKQSEHLANLANEVKDQTEEIAKKNPDNKAHQPREDEPPPMHSELPTEEDVKAALKRFPDIDEIFMPEQQAVKKKKVLMRPTVLINDGDTLVSLAEAYFHDANLGWLIADLNSDQIKQSWIDGKRVVEVRSRQVLELPVWDDIQEFYQQRRPEAHPDNLVTIVEKAQVDVELLNSSLSVAMGVKRYNLSFKRFLTES